MEQEIHYRPLTLEDTKRVDLRCLPEENDVLARLFEDQGTIGMGAWEDGRCIGMMHAYRVKLPDYSEDDFPEWAHANPLLWPLGWPLRYCKERGIGFDGPVWGHACFHVGRTEGGDGGGAPWDRRYFSRGIGTALCRESVAWAKRHDYAAVIAQGAPAGMFQYAVHFGVLPWTTYEKLGFHEIGREEDGERLPWWTKGKVMPAVRPEVERELQHGRAAADFCSRLMVLDLK
jgi:GNAT superfamily N-acetyltransferase